MNQIESWSRYLAAQGYAPNTVSLYADCVQRCLDAIHALQPEDTTPDMLENWMVANETWSPSAKKYNYIAVRSFFRYLLDKQVIASDPSTILPQVKTKRHIDESQDRGKEDRVYSTEDLKAMMEFTTRQKCFAVRDQAIIALMAATGMRASEICWLTVGQLKNREGNVIFALRKGQNIRRITVAEFAFPYVQRYLSQRAFTDELTDDSPLFVTKGGKAVTRFDIYHMLAVRQKALGLRTGTHNVRYTVINAIERSANPVVARDIAGQKSISVTNNYLVSQQGERSSALNSLPWFDAMQNLRK